MTIDETNPHYKFAKYLEAIGCPKLEVLSGSDNKWLETINDVHWFESNTYRIKGDRHWQLRKEWVDSGYELPIEYFSETADEWVRLYYLTPKTTQWIQYFEYRKAETKQDQPMTDKLPELIKGKKLELIDAPISNLPECLSALSAGHVLKTDNGFHFLDGDMFAYVDNYGNKPTRTNDFYFQPFIAAYKLVDAPWWENIPDGGVVCKHIKGGLSVVVDVQEENGVMFAVLPHLTAYYPINDFTPVTDQWLESMKRGF